MGSKLVRGGIHRFAELGSGWKYSQIRRVTRWLEVFHSRLAVVQNEVISRWFEVVQLCKV